MTRGPTQRQLDMLAAWWWAKGDNAKAAFVLGIQRQSLKNGLYTFRYIEGADSNVELVQTYMDAVLERRPRAQRKAA